MTTVADLLDGIEYVRSGAFLGQLSEAERSRFKVEDFSANIRQWLQDTYNNFAFAGHGNAFAFAGVKALKRPLTATKMQKIRESLISFSKPQTPDTAVTAGATVLGCLCSSLLAAESMVSRQVTITDVFNDTFKLLLLPPPVRIKRPSIATQTTVVLAEFKPDLPQEEKSLPGPVSFLKPLPFVRTYQKIVPKIT